MSKMKNKLLINYLKSIIELGKTVVNKKIYHGYNNWYNLMGQIHVYENNGNSVTSETEFEQYIRNRMQSNIGFVDEKICSALSWPTYGWPTEAKKAGIGVSQNDKSHTYNYMMIKLNCIILQLELENESEI